MSKQNEMMKWLQKYYASCCNGDWEHTYGITIETLDNPGWSIEINLEETNLSNRSFEKIQVQRNEEDWIICRIENNVFQGDGGSHNLIEILSVFKEWVEKIESQPTQQK